MEVDRHSLNNLPYTYIYAERPGAQHYTVKDVIRTISSVLLRNNFTQVISYFHAPNPITPSPAVPNYLSVEWAKKSVAPRKILYETADGQYMLLQAYATSLMLPAMDRRKVTNQFRAPGKEGT